MGVLFFGYNTSRYSGRGCRQERECVYPLKYLGAGVEQLLTCLLCVCVYVYNLITALITPCEKLRSSLKVSNDGDSDGGDDDDINLKLTMKIRSIDDSLKFCLNTKVETKPSCCFESASGCHHFKRASVHSLGPVILKFSSNLQLCQATCNFLKLEIMRR